MAKTTIDELLSAVEAVQVIKQAVARHDQAIGKMLDKLDLIEDRLDAIEAKAGRGKP